MLGEDHSGKIEQNTCTHEPRRKASSGAPTRNSTGSNRTHGRRWHRDGRRRRSGLHLPGCHRPCDDHHQDQLRFLHG
ncbi:hypothetical protein ACFPRL_27850 [Pseudoclavibacter helvolus]